MHGRCHSRERLLEMPHDQVKVACVDEYKFRGRMGRSEWCGAKTWVRSSFLNVLPRQKSKL